MLNQISVGHMLDLTLIQMVGHVISVDIVTLDGLELEEGPRATRATLGLDLSHHLVDVDRPGPFHPLFAKLPDLFELLLVVDFFVRVKVSLYDWLVRPDLARFEEVATVVLLDRLLFVSHRFRPTAI